MTTSDALEAVPDWCRACDAFAAERAARYLIEGARREAGAKYWQGAASAAFVADVARRMPELSAERTPHLALLAARRVLRVPERALQGLFTWAAGFGVELREDVPRAEEVLALQSRGRRCVSLLPESVSPAPHASGLEFLVHDLCHLQKFSEPVHHLEQVGFFMSLAELGEAPGFSTLEAELDALWSEDRNRLASDVNGSAVYLFSLLKMKLKMAARRHHARTAGIPARVAGVLDAREAAVFDALATLLYDGLGFQGELRAAAHATSARRDDHGAAEVVAREFRRRGAAALTARAVANPRP